MVNTVTLISLSLGVLSIFDNLHLESSAVSLKGTLELKFIPQNTSVYNFALDSKRDHAIFLDKQLNGLM